MPEAPDDLDRPLALVVFEVGGAEIREGDRRGVALLHVPAMAEALERQAGQRPGENL